MASKTLTSHRGALSVGGILLALIVFFGVNIVSNNTLGTIQLDLTADRLYTLSPGTKSVLAKIQEPITLRFYFSDRLGREIPSYGVFAGRVRDMLNAYRVAADGKVKLEFIDPKPFTDEEDRAVAFGLQGVPIDQGGDQVYFGLAGSNTADKDEVIPFFQPERERLLEYDLTKLVFNLTVTKKPAVGLLSMLPLQGEPRGPMQAGDPWAVYTQMSQFFDLKMIDSNTETIPNDIGVLVVVHPNIVTDRALYAIDQFVLRGGRAIVFVDPHAEGELTRPGVPAQTGLTGSDMKDIFKAWGIELVPNRVAGDRLSARRVSAGTGTETRVRAVDYVAWLQLKDNVNFNRSDILTAQTGIIQMASAGIIQPREGATTTVTPLLQTSREAMQIDVNKVKREPNPVALLAEFKSDDKPYILAARISGKVKTAYPEGPIPEKKEGEENPPKPPLPAGHLAESKDPINVIVIADTDMLEDRFWAQVQDFFGQKAVVPIASNGEFVVNAIDNMLGSDALLSLRTRGQVARPFTIIQDMQRDAELAFRAKERDLQEKLKDTEKKLQDLQGRGGGGQEASGRTVMSKEQQEAIEQFRAEMLVTRRELRDVQRELRRDIETLEMGLKFVNIGLVPLFVALAAIVVGIVRIRRRAPSRRPQTAIT